MKQNSLTLRGFSPVLENSHGQSKTSLLTSVSHHPRFSSFGVQEDEQYANNRYQEKLNRLRASVLGANDGIVSVAATVVGVAGATSSTSTIAITAAAAVIGGAISMALGEYVSVYSQVDSQEALIEKEKDKLVRDP